MVRRGGPQVNKSEQNQVNKQKDLRTDMSEKITFPQFRCRAVKHLMI